MREVPSLATVRPFLAPRPLEWVNSVLAGVPQAEFSRQHGLRSHSVTMAARYVAEAAGLDITGMSGGPIREAVLRMRIKELEEMRGRA
jgi:hypothetical protein